MLFCGGAFECARPRKSISTNATAPISHGASLTNPALNCYEPKQLPFGRPARNRKLWGHRNVSTTMIDTHLLDCPDLAVRRGVLDDQPDATKFLNIQLDATFSSNSRYVFL